MREEHTGDEPVERAAGERDGALARVDRRDDPECDDESQRGEEDRRERAVRSVPRENPGDGQSRAHGPDEPSRKERPVLIHAACVRAT